MVVFVVDKHKKPLDLTTEKRAKQLLDKGAAIVHRHSPFVIRLKNVEQKNVTLSQYRVKIDVGFKTTGIVIVRETENETCIKYACEVKHSYLKDKLDSRRSLRRGRRNRNTRYRSARFDNRRKRQNKFVKYWNSKYEWLAPTLVKRVMEIVRVTEKLIQYCPISAISVEHVKFDTQLMENPDIKGVEYQQGELMGYEVREYLLERYSRKCAYCKGESKDPSLEVEHIIPKAITEINRISNLCISCHTCNKEKGKLHPKEWLTKLQKSKRKIDKIRYENFSKIAKGQRPSLKGTAHVNTTRWFTFERLKDFGLPVECGTGARTKMNRCQQKLPKSHVIDAACVGKSTKEVVVDTQYKDVWSYPVKKRRQFTDVDKYGFPRSKPKTRQKIIEGFKTGDLVKVVITNSRKVEAGEYIGIVGTKASGQFRITTQKPIGYKKDREGNFKLNKKGEKLPDYELSASHNKCELIERGTGWNIKREKIELNFHSQNSDLSQNAIV